jgi:hypothetical protein
MSTTTTPAPHVWRPSNARRIVLDGFLPVPRGTLPTTPPPLSWPAKDPSDVLDYEFDVTAALVGNEGDAITTVAVAITPDATGDLVLNSSAADGSRAVFWFAGGQSGTVYVVQITIVTVNGRTIGRAVLLPVLPLASAAAAATALTTDAGATITDQNGNPILTGS